ncbi:hypothetical protein [Sphingomonas sp.]|jgi:hypothetical protein|uniref:DUF6894 family protein n=1 Tax=Sphingomonas sp. TaxID=28214 RepID=UPI00262E2C9A|nr:hypothetical protein [Sphingomonas sp.]MDF2495573.1 hypothetical protein [Sphingomonas sp.]
MARYFFHIRDHSSSILDEEGRELPDRKAAEAKALEAARDTLSHDIKSGFIDLRYRIEVEDDDGIVIHVLPLEDAFVVRR